MYKCTLFININASTVNPPINVDSPIISNNVGSGAITNRDLNLVYIEYIWLFEFLLVL